MDIKTTIDPTGYFASQASHEMEYAIESLGILPHWVTKAEDTESIREAFDRQYNFGLFEFHGITINAEGVFSYPEDPDLYPIISMVRGSETAYFYQSAMVAIINKDQNIAQFVTRMD